MWFHEFFPSKFHQIDMYFRFTWMSFTLKSCQTVAGQQSFGVIVVFFGNFWPFLFFLLALNLSTFSSVKRLKQQHFSRQTEAGPKSFVVTVAFFADFWPFLFDFGLEFVNFGLVGQKVKATFFLVKLKQGNKILCETKRYQTVRTTTARADIHCSAPDRCVCVH